MPKAPYVMPDAILASIQKRDGRTRQIAKDKGSLLAQAEVDRHHLLAEVARLRRDREQLARALGVDLSALDAGTWRDG